MNKHDPNFLKFLTSDHSIIRIIFPDGEIITDEEDQKEALESEHYIFGEGNPIKQDIYLFTVDEASFEEHVGRLHVISELDMNKDYGNRPEMTFYNDKLSLSTIFSNMIRSHFRKKENLKKFKDFIKQVENNDKYHVFLKSNMVLGIKYHVAKKHLVGDPHKVNYVDFIIAVEKTSKSSGSIYLINILGYSNKSGTF